MFQSKIFWGPNLAFFGLGPRANPWYEIKLANTMNFDDIIWKLWQLKESLNHCELNAGGSNFPWELCPCPCRLTDSESGHLGGHTQLLLHHTVILSLVRFSHIDNLQSVAVDTAILVTLLEVHVLVVDPAILESITGTYREGHSRARHSIQQGDRLEIDGRICCTEREAGQACSNCYISAGKGHIKKLAGQIVYLASSLFVCLFMRTF